MKTVSEVFLTFHPLRPILNRNTIKISYCTMSSMEQQISGINKKKLHSGESVEPDLSCNCRVDPCPLQGRCNVKNIVYHATVTQQNNCQSKVSSYYGLTARKCIERFRQHKRSFRVEFLNTDTALAEKVWAHKQNNIVHNVTFDIHKVAQSHNPGKSAC